MQHPSASTPETTSRAVLLESFGGPEVLNLREVPAPQAGLGQIRVRVTAAGLNPMDWFMTTDAETAARFGLSLPSGFGTDYAGVVDQVGDGVSGFAAGDRVFGGALSRAVADYVVIDVAGTIAAGGDAHHTPDGVDDRTAATLAIGGCTAAAALAVVRAGPADTLLIGGAGGGVGVFAVQLARLAGARVIGTGSATSAEALRALGAEPVAYGDGLASRVRALAPGGVTAAIDLYATETVQAARELGVPDERITTIAAQVDGVTPANGANAAPGAIEEIARLVAAGQLPGAIRQIKTALRARIMASGRSVEEVFAVIESRVRAQAEQIAAQKARGETVWPVIEYADIAAGTVTAGEVARLRQRGCLVVRGHFDRDQALRWDQDIVSYVESNRFFETYRGPGDDFFGSVGSKPEIYPIYWSPAQMQARQSDRMAAVQSFLNAQWTSQSDGVQWFDPQRDSLYPDRIRRRPEGADSAGLGTHLDPGTLDLWMTRACQQAFRHLFDGTVEAYDPWDAAHRTTGQQYPGTTMCSVFRTFQGWTALSDMDHDQGVLHTVPIPEAMGYLMLRPLLGDVPDDDMCGVTTNKVFPVSDTWHPLLLDALTGIPDVRAGDSVWWHCDMIHSVAPVENQKGWGNVMYIPAAPWCPRNERYAASVREAFMTGASPGDFPAENYERDWPGRFQPGDLNQAGRRGLDLE